MQPLPIDELIPQIVASLRQHRNLVLTAEPGAGKTTRVPAALLSLDDKEVWVLEPRRLATRLAALRVAEERAERIGETVGYQVRLEDVSSARTRLRFVTEGILSRRMLRDRTLQRIGTVVLDEFHERHLETDLAFALLRRLQATTRPDLRIVVMSATVDAEALSRVLDDCPVLHASGRVFPLEISYSGSSPLRMEEQAAQAVESLARKGLQGDVLVFLPGAAEIRRTMRALESTRLPVVPLHGDLSFEEQDRAVQITREPKVICSTNVAESSVTLPGVRAVVDSGLARVAETSTWSGLQRVRVTKVSQASAKQRAGRAGRLGPGRVVRLYSEVDLKKRPEFDLPEIARADLSGVMLSLLAAGERIEELPWLEMPPEASIRAGRELLETLGALNVSGLTEVGSAMAEYAAGPRVARMLVEARQRKVLDLAAEVAAALSLGERLPEGRHASGPSDLLALVETRNEKRQALARQFGKRGREYGDEKELLRSVLAGFPDRVAKRRSKGSNELLLSAGGAATLDERSVVREAEFVVAVEVEQRDDQAQPLVRLASAIEADWLLDAYLDRVEEVDRTEWNKREERVERVSQLRYGQIALLESRGVPGDEAQMLAEQAWIAGFTRFMDAEEWEALRGRLVFAARAMQLDLDLEALQKATLLGLSEGLRSFAELKRAASDGGARSILLTQLPEGLGARLDRVAPDRLRLPSGRNAKIFYPEDAPPYVASRLQDFFGMRESPKVAEGRVSLVVHLLAPNQRPVQMTQDLAGFWERLYPQVRRELGRRYPRHKWPEDPYQPEG